MDRAKEAEEVTVHVYCAVIATHLAEQELTVGNKTPHELALSMLSGEMPYNHFGQGPVPGNQ